MIHCKWFMIAVIFIIITIVFTKIIGNQLFITL